MQWKIRWITLDIIHTRQTLLLVKMIYRRFFHVWKEGCPSGASESVRREDWFKNKIPFYCSVKRTKLKKSNTSKPQISKDSKKVSLGSVDSQTVNRKNDCQTSLSPQSEMTCRSPGLLKDCTNTIESNLELPVLELENNVNQRQPDGVSSQQKPCSVKSLKSSLLSENSPCSSESA